MREKLKFQGSPDVAFEAQVWINLKNEIETKEWLDKMQQHSQVTYRVTKTHKPGLKRVYYANSNATSTYSENFN